jgi:DNA invertase Pin-like site-specific DNA recombinase
MVAKWLVEHPGYILSDQSYHDYGKSGYSGKHLENAFGRLLAAVENGDIPRGSTILIEQIDRAGRLEPMEMLPLVSRIVNAGVDLITLDDGIVYNRESSNSNHLFLLVAKVQAAYLYSDTLSRRLKATYKTKREKAAAGEGATRRMPLWIRDGKLREDIAPFVTQVFEDFAAGIGERRILRRLKEQHPDFETISPSTFRRWLRNPVAVGRWNDIEDVWPAVISKELWFRVQKRLSDNNIPRSGSSKYLLSGLVKCVRCGKNYCVWAGATGAKAMLCVTRHRYGHGPEGCSNSRSIPYAVLDYVRVQTSKAALARAAQSRNLNANEKRQIEIAGEIQELHRQAEHAAEGLARYGMVKAITDVLDRVTAQTMALEQEQAMLKVAPSPPTKLDLGLLELSLWAGDPEKFNAILQSVGYVIWVDDRTITVSSDEADAERPSQVFRFVRTDRVKGVFEVLHDDGTIVSVVNPEAAVRKPKTKSLPPVVADFRSELAAFVSEIDSRFRK